MATLRVYDCEFALVLDLRHLIDLLAPQSLQATWTVSPVKTPDECYFWATGDASEQLEALADCDGQVSGVELSKLAKEIVPREQFSFQAT